MKTGNFSAVGWEASVRPVVFFLLLAGALQIFVVLFVSELYSFIIPSLLLMVASLVGFLALNVSAHRTVGVYEVSYIDKRSDGGFLEISYAREGSDKAEALKVKSISASHRPLSLPTYSKGVRYDNDTVASLTVNFTGGQKARRLELGFSSETEMNHAYEQLR